MVGKALDIGRSSRILLNHFLQNSSLEPSWFVHGRSPDRRSLALSRIHAPCASMRCIQHDCLPFQKTTREIEGFDLSTQTETVLQRALDRPDAVTGRSSAGSGRLSNELLPIVSPSRSEISDGAGSGEYSTMSRKCLLIFSPLRGFADGSLCSRSFSLILSCTWRPYGDWPSH